MLNPDNAESSKPPLVTVAMPIFNAGLYLRLAVVSIVRQTFQDWELLIIDDGSTDNALQHIADIRDDRIRVLRDGKNRGLAARLNECIALARGRYFARMDQDDVCYPERFSRQVQALNADDTLDVVAVRAVTIAEDNQLTGLFPGRRRHAEICARPWMGFYFPHPTWMGRIEWFRNYQYAEPGPYFCEDQELLLRSYRTSKLATLDEILFAYRIRSDINCAKLARTRRTVLRVQLRYFFGAHLWHYALLALLAYAGKTGRDFFRRHDRVPLPLDEAVVSRWETILQHLSTQPITP